MSTRETEWTAPISSHWEEIKTLAEYLAGVRRRKWLVVLTTVLILGASVGVALGLPPIYRSTGTILIERQEIPSEWVPASVSSYADQRIQTISQRVLTTDNLLQVIEKWNIYTEERRKQGTEAVVQQVREDFSIDMISADVRDPGSGRSGRATIAFSVSFEHRNPAVAQNVANDLVSLYLEENLRTRTEAVADTTRFLEEEAGKLSDQLSEIEGRIAAFKEKNMGRLPEQQDLNLQLMQRAEQALLETQRQIQSMEERKIYLEVAVAQMQSRPPQALTDPAGDPSAAPTDIDSLRARYASLSATYSEDHPDMVRLRRQIQALQQAPQARVAGAPRPAESANPLYIKTQADLDTIESELTTLRAQAKKFAATVRSIERRIAETPRVEQEYHKLVRDRENLVVKYQEISAKQSSARVAEALEEERKGERFSLIEPPQYPQKPIKPNRLAILMLGAAASLFGGFGIAVTREMFDQSVRTTRSAIAATHAPVLAVIPVIETAADRRRARRNWILILTAVVLCAIVTAALVHFYYKPLDMLWYEQVQRRLDSL